MPASQRQEYRNHASEKSGTASRLLPFLGTRRGQGVVEYAVLLAVVVGALALMSLYVKHAVAGRWRGAADSMGEQYDPRRTTSPGGMTLKIDSKMKTESTLIQDKVLKDGSKADVMETKTTIEKDETIRSGSETVGTPGATLWN